jgi:hypothetical protein
VLTFPPGQRGALHRDFVNAQVDLHGTAFAVARKSASLTGS